MVLEENYIDLLNKLWDSLSSLELPNWATLLIFLFILVLIIVCFIFFKPDTRNLSDYIKNFIYGTRNAVSPGIEHADHMKEIPKEYINKSVTYFDENETKKLARHLCDEEKDSSYDNVMKVIEKMKITGETLLNQSKKDLTIDFVKANVNKITQRIIFKLRHDLRKLDFDKREDKALRDIKALNSYDFACVFEKRVKSGSIFQRNEWYDYIEEQLVDGETFTEEFCKNAEKVLNLTDSQKLRLKNFYEEINPKKNEAGTHIQQTIYGNIIGPSATGQGTVTAIGSGSGHVDKKDTDNADTKHDTDINTREACTGPKNSNNELKLRRKNKNK